MISKKIEFFRHNISSQDIGQTVKILKSIFLTTGTVTKEFEKKLANYLGAKHAIGLTSCTDALFLGLKYFDVKDGDEVITSPLSFVSTANVIEHCGAKPVFAEVEEGTGNINADTLERYITKRTKVIIPVHLYGQMCDMKKIRKIANKYKLKVIEDSAHCLEGSRDGAKPGKLGDMACFSFYATKTITCGEGGAIVCNSDSMYEWFAKARLHGISKNAADRYTGLYQHYDMEFLGYKCNMTNIQASLLISQIEKAEKFRVIREKLCQIYDRLLKNNTNIKIPLVLASTKHARYVYTIQVNPNKRDDYLHEIQNKGIGVAVNFRPIHLMTYYKKIYHFKPGVFPIAEKIGDSTITIPLYPKLTHAQVAYVAQMVNQVVVE